MFTYSTAGSIISWNGRNRYSNNTAYADIFACTISLSLYNLSFPVAARRRRARFRRMVCAEVSGRQQKRTMKEKEEIQRSSKMGQRQSFNSAAKPP
jgi:hypothetical protein